MIDSFTTHPLNSYIQGYVYDVIADGLGGYFVCGLDMTKECPYGLQQNLIRRSLGDPVRRFSNGTWGEPHVSHKCQGITLSHWPLHYLSPAPDSLIFFKNSLYTHSRGDVFSLHLLEGEPYWRKERSGGSSLLRVRTAFTQWVQLYG
jgi:hypothetical protein